MITTSNTLARQSNGLISTGILNLSPGSTNTVPGLVTFSLDIRHPNDNVVDALEIACESAFQEIAETEGLGCEVQWRLDFCSKAMKFDPGCIRAVKEASVGEFGAEGEGWMEISSGAGHDRYVRLYCGRENGRRGSGRRGREW
jgi:acetylornithine deacetylase/succinyl-diaminopimelate desuccinylase-like protein